MAEPATTGLLGLKYQTLIAGFGGGIVWLSFAPHMTPWRMVISVMVATLCAGYFTPLISQALPWVSSVEASAGFVVGFLAFVILPGLLSAATAVAADPIGAVSRWRTGGKP